jgi:hypothetical protein
LNRPSAAVYKNLSRWATFFRGQAKKNQASEPGARRMRLAIEWARGEREKK